MAKILLDSANIKDTESAAELGFVKGITTNPTLMKRETSDPVEHTSVLLQTGPWEEFYYQPTGIYGSLQKELESVLELDEKRIILKLPATPDGILLAKKMSDIGARIALTAAQSPQIIAVAESAGYVAVIPYFDRAMRDIRTESTLIQSMAKIRCGKTSIIAASVKNVGQVIHTFYQGADAVTISLKTIKELLEHPGSIEAEQAFLEEYRN